MDFAEFENKKTLNATYHIKGSNNYFTNIDLIRPKNPELFLSSDISGTDSPRMRREIFR